MILLHGGLETCRMWATAVPIPAGKYRVITPDSRGHGRTDNPSGEISYRLMAEDIAHLIRGPGLDQPFVGGYSDGGQVALCMAMYYPGLARGYMVGAAELQWRDVEMDIIILIQLTTTQDGHVQLIEDTSQR